MTPAEGDRESSAPSAGPGGPGREPSRDLARIVGCLAMGLLGTLMFVRLLDSDRESDAFFWLLLGWAIAGPSVAAALFGIGAGAGVTASAGIAAGAGMGAVLVIAANRAIGYDASTPLAHTIVTLSAVAVYAISALPVGSLAYWRRRAALP